MHPDKASGHDVLNPTFFQHFWGILGNEVFLCCSSWPNEVSFPTVLNETNVVLILKIENIDMMNDLRPITVCNIHYKIHAKVLATGLKFLSPLLFLRTRLLLCWVGIFLKMFWLLLRLFKS